MMKKFLAVILALALLLTLTVSAFAGPTPSVEQQEIEGTPVDGHDAIITTPEGETEYADKGSMLELVITPYNEKEQAIVDEITQKLNSAGQEILEAEDVTALTGSILQALAQINEANGTNLTPADLFVLDVFDASLIKDQIQYYEAPDGSSITFAVKTNLRPGDIFFILENLGEDSWEIITDIQLAEDGTLIITVKKLGVFAIIAAKDPSVAIDPRGPRSPQTGADISKYLWLTAAALVVAGVFCASTSNGKRKKSE